MHDSRKPVRHWTVSRIILAILVVGTVMAGVHSFLQGRRAMAGMMCRKNLGQIRFQMVSYGGEHQIEGDGLWRMAGVLIGNTNFNAQYGFYKTLPPSKKSSNVEREDCWNWRYSRDGLFATCPLSSSDEHLSYEGWPTTNIVLAAGIPLLWEKGAYHDGQRCVFCYDRSNMAITMIPDAEFHALTNSFVKYVSRASP